MRGDKSELVRKVAIKSFVEPARKKGESQVVIPVKEMIDLLSGTSFPVKNVPQICSALDTEKFWKSNGMELTSIDGPASKRSTSVVFRFAFDDRRAAILKPTSSLLPAKPETSEEWAKRLAGRLQGLLKEELAEYGGGEAFIRWMREDGDDL